MNNSVKSLFVSWICTWIALVVTGAEPAKAPPEFPRAQIIPQPNTQFSFQIDGREVLRYNAGADAPKPYFFPVIGPCGRPITRIGHPRDPVGHGHHLSLWIGCKEVGGDNFWENGPKSGRIIQDRVVKIDDGSAASLAIRAKWVNDQGKVLLIDDRVWTLTPIDGAAEAGSVGEYFLDLSLTLTPEAPSITLGKTPFGLVAVRVAKTMGVADGGGQITNSEGAINEPATHWKPARWCDYSGPAAPGIINGITLFDHPKNPGFPTHFHTRNDGWMCASVNYGGALEVSKEKPLLLRYRFWVHRAGCDPAATDVQWKRWSEADPGK